MQGTVLTADGAERVWNAIIFQALRLGGKFPSANHIGHASAADSLGREPNQQRIPTTLRFPKRRDNRPSFTNSFEAFFALTDFAWGLVPRTVLFSDLQSAPP